MGFCIFSILMPINHHVQEAVCHVGHGGVYASGRGQMHFGRCADLRIQGASPRQAALLQAIRDRSSKWSDFCSRRLSGGLLTVAGWAQGRDGLTFAGVPRHGTGKCRFLTAGVGQ